MAVLSGDDAKWARYGSAPLIVTLVLPIVIGVILLLKCILNHCCVRKTTTKEEMYGVEGRMTILANAESSFVTSTLPQQTSNSSSVNKTIATTATTTATTTQTTNLNHQSHNFNKPDHTKIVSLKISSDSALDVPACVSLPATDGVHQLASDSYETVDLNDSLKRTTLHRQLPDLPQIPQQTNNPPRRSSSVLSHDGTSELYATVGEVPNPTSNAPTTSIAAVNHYSDINHRQSSKKSVLPSSSRVMGSGEPSASTNKSLKSIPSEPTPSSDSETYGTNHPYAKLKRNTSEHPYTRVRTTNVENDEETDTDNYDIPQPYAQTRPRPQNSNTGQQSSSNLSQPSVSSSGSANLNSASEPSNGPVPPRRVGRQWRRSSHPQAQNNDNQPNFSGDSQDSRGYTSISVREPLSNIRSQVSNTRLYDSHYATVSDDSEEMYAAIEDASDGNYQRIAGEDGEGRHLWIGGVNVASPIPERREANSPLPPVPPVPPVPNAPPPEVAPTNNTAAQSPANVPSQAPVYAQVVKKPKKGKAPVTPTMSNASTSSQLKDNPTNDSSTTAASSSGVSLLPGPSTATSSSAPFSSHHHQSKNRHTIMDGSNYKDSSSDMRRWSKADISYSEFEVVRETLFTNSNNNSSPESSPRIAIFDSKITTRESIPNTSAEPNEILDEDNYNVIPDTSSSNPGLSRASGGRHSSGKKSKSRHRKISDSGNYQEIEGLTNPYQEIEPKHKKETSSDHYQEIGLLARHGADIYQEIDRDKSLEYEEDEEDQFYEKVKPSSKASAKKPDTLALPSKEESLDRKHGYEKLKKKGQPSYSNVDVVKYEANSPGNALSAVSDLDDDDDDDGKHDGDSLYEKVKYPPYERLKESREDLADVENDLDDANLYEAIGYSRVKPKHKRKQPENHEVSPSCGNADPFDPNNTSIHFGKEADANDEPTSVADLDQLYARVDKAKKKKNSITVDSSVTISDNLTSNSAKSQDTVDDKGSNTVIRKISSTSAGSSIQVVAEDNISTVDYGTQTEETNQHIDNSIEYI